MVTDRSQWGAFPRSPPAPRLLAPPRARTLTVRLASGSGEGVQAGRTCAWDRGSAGPDRPLRVPRGASGVSPAPCSPARLAPGPLPPRTRPPTGGSGLRGAVTGEGPQDAGLREGEGFVSWSHCPQSLASLLCPPLPGLPLPTCRKLPFQRILGVLTAVGVNLHPPLWTPALWASIPHPRACWNVSGLCPRGSDSVHLGRPRAHRSDQFQGLLVPWSGPLCTGDPPRGLGDPNGTFRTAWPCLAGSARLALTV